TGKSMGARFASRLALGAVTVVSAVVLATEPLTNTGFGKTWAATSQHYQIIPNAVLRFIAPAAPPAALVSVIAERGGEGSRGGRAGGRCCSRWWQSRSPCCSPTCCG